MKERLVICYEEDTDGPARVTRDEERVPSPLPLQLFGTNSLLTLNLQLGSLSRVKTELHSQSLLPAPPRTVQRHHSASVIHIDYVTITLYHMFLA